jgi:long-chain fatty acid transport protein
MEQGMKHRSDVLAWSVSAALMGLAGGAGASGFALIEQNGSGLGNAYAGVAAVAEDASTIFFNPAGMTRLPGRQAVAAAHAIRPSIKFNDGGSTRAPLQPTLGGNGSDAGGWVFVPNAYLSWQLNPQWHVGLGLNAPFGLKTEYDTEWVGRYHGIKSKMVTVNVNPSVAFKLSDSVSIGGGVSYQRAEATLTNAVNYSAAASGLLGAGLEGIARVDGDDDGWGYNVGALFNLGPQTRIGVAYRSAISYKLAGNVGFSNRPAALAAAIPNGPVSADVRVPALASFSIFHQLDPKWDVMADISWTGWSTLKTLNIVRANGALLATTPLNWSDTWRFSMGANYRSSDAWMWRMGVAYDQTPVPDSDRTPRIPDENRTWVAVGAQYKVSRQAAIDVGAAYLFLKDGSSRLCDAANAAAHPTACAGKNALIGVYKDNITLLTAQLRYDF